MTHISIKDWKEDDRPREKLKAKGINALSDAELIAILLGSGSKDESALALAQRILSTAKNSIQNLANFSIADLMLFKGVGEAKAITMLSAMELCKRKELELASKVTKIATSKEVFEILKPTLSHLKHEEFWVLYLNNSNVIIHKEQLSKGGLTATVADIRIIFKNAVTLLASSIILAHNHPSGNLQPSTQDKELTEKVKKSGALLDVKLLDHLIITSNSYFSFTDEGIL